MHATLPKLRILCDLDSTITAFLEAWVTRYNEAYGDSLWIDQITDWSIHKFVKPECGKAIYQLAEDPTLFRNVMPLDGAIDGLRRLHDAGHQLYIATSCLFPENFAAKAAWVEEHLPFLPAHRVIPIKDKHLLKGDVLIDDGPHNILDYRKEWCLPVRAMGGCVKDHDCPLLACIEYPYNHDAKAAADIFAVGWKDPAAAWATIVKGIEDYAGGL